MNGQDTLNFLSKLTPRKAMNAIQVLSSYYLSRIFPIAKPWGHPFSLSVEPTTACNLRCPECPSGLRSFTRPTGKIAPGLLSTILDQTAKDLLFLIFYFQGEPYIHPDFLQMVKQASKKKIYTITSTNGHFLNDANARETVLSGLNRLVISIDGTTQEAYSSYRKGGSLENVLEGTKNVITWKRKLKSNTPHIVFQFLVVRHNESQINEVEVLAKSLGVDQVSFKSAQLYDYKNGHDLMPTQEKYSRYKKKNDGTYKLKYALKNECWKQWHSAVITWNGKVVPCCFDKDAQYQLGDLNKDTLDEIWHSDPYTQFRKRIKKDRSAIDICQNCTEGCKVWV